MNLKWLETFVDPQYDIWKLQLSDKIEISQNWQDLNFQDTSNKFVSDNRTYGVNFAKYKIIMIFAQGYSIWIHVWRQLKLGGGSAMFPSGGSLWPIFC